MLVHGYRGRRLAGDADVSSAIGVAESAASAKHAIFVGVTTGVMVWTITRLLDRIFGFSRDQ